MAHEGKFRTRHKGIDSPITDLLLLKQALTHPSYVTTTITQATSTFNFSLSHARRTLGHRYIIRQPKLPFQSEVTDEMKRIIELTLRQTTVREKGETAKSMRADNAIGKKLAPLSLNI